MVLKNEVTSDLNRSFTINKTTKAKTNNPKRLMKTLSSLNASHKAISPARKTKKGFFSKSFMVGKL